MFPTVLTATGVLDGAGTSITNLLSWIGDIISSLLTADGALAPLWPFILVGFGVSILMLAIKVVRSFSWGI